MPHELTITMHIDDAAELIKAYDAWKGSLPPEEHDEYMERMSHIRVAIARLKTFAEESEK